jgi:type 1 fimbria pilin
VRVRRSSAGWLTAGNLVVQLKTGATFGPAIPVDASDHLLLSSPSALTNQVFELRYSLQNVTAENAPGPFSAQITYTVTEI